MNKRITTVGSYVMVVVFAVGCLMLAYARWSHPIAYADAALASGDIGPAIDAYAVAEERFDALPPLKWLLPSEYNRVIASQLRILYYMELYEETIERAARAPAQADAHFWAAAALFQMGLVEEEGGPSARLAWFGRAQQELMRALDVTPDDWDIKYDLELVLRITDEMRRLDAPSELMKQLLRPRGDDFADRPIG
jgi:tetratricopeptide (TPR) repeat protein